MVCLRIVCHVILNQAAAQKNSILSQPYPHSRIVLRVREIW